MSSGIYCDLFISSSCSRIAIASWCFLLTNLLTFLSISFARSRTLLKYSSGGISEYFAKVYSLPREKIIVLNSFLYVKEDKKRVKLSK